MQFLMSGYLRNRTVRAFASEADKALIEANPDFEVILRDWYGYGNDYYLTGSDFSFTEIPDEDYAVLFRYDNWVEYNNDVVCDYLAKLKNHLERTNETF